MSLVPNAEYIRVDADHVVHEDKVGEFIRLVGDFFLQNS